MNKRPDGACVFLDDANRCRIHAEQGESAKPLACRVFPFSVRSVAKGWQASFRLDCPSAAASKGASLESHRAWLQTLANELDHAAPTEDQLPCLSRAVRATSQECDQVLDRFAAWLKRDDAPWNERLIGTARAVTLLSGAKFDKIRGARLAELLDLVFAALPAESKALPRPPGPRQRGMLRQLAFAHGEHVTLTELRAGWIAGLRKRWRQVRMARRFRLGQGAAPSIAPVNSSPPTNATGEQISFESVENVGIAGTDAPAVSDLLRRYLLGRLHARSVFGSGYYAWPVFTGLGAWVLSVAAAGWLARYHAARCGRTTLTFDDAACGIGIVDRGATRLPALGSLAERTRLSYLLREDGLTRLVAAYALTNSGLTSKGSGTT